MADVFSPTGTSFLKSFVFILEGLVDSRFAGGHSWDINLGFGLFCFLVGLWSHAPWLLVALDSFYLRLQLHLNFTDGSALSSSA